MDCHWKKRGGQGTGTGEKEVAKATQLGRTPHIEIDAETDLCQRGIAKVHNFRLRADGCFPAQHSRTKNNGLVVSKLQDYRHLMQTHTAKSGQRREWLISRETPTPRSTGRPARDS